MPEPAAHPVPANVAYLRIAGFASRPVAEQAALKERLVARARAAIAPIPAAQRMVLDADDGLALVVLGDPEVALDLAQAMREGGGEAKLHAGLGHGPLGLCAPGPDVRVFGDGLVGAEAAARFSAPDQLLVTQEFARALEAAAPGRARELEAAGEATDAHMRKHAFFAPDPARRAARRRRMALAAMAGVAAILLLGVGAREANRRLFPPKPAIVKLEVKPRGEVFVDGVSRGRTPPLAELEIPAGRHVLQVRNPGYPPLEIELDLKAGERMTVAHTFSKAEPQPGFWGDLRRKFGL